MHPLYSLQKNTYIAYKALNFVVLQQVEDDVA